MKVVVKVGGATLDDAVLMRVCVDAITSLAKAGHSVVAVHGGGSAITRTLRKMGRSSSFVNGLRVTDAESRDVALMILAGAVNKTLVTALNRAGICAVGICGGDGKTIVASKKRDLTHDLGFVGDVAAFDRRWLDVILCAGGVPVLAPIAPDDKGEYYNVNADRVASACAGAVGADLLVFLTDVAGVKQSDGTVIPSLKTSEISELLLSSIVTGGMLPKLAACQQALDMGVNRVRILPATEAGLLSQLCVEQVACGTELVSA